MIPKLFLWLIFHNPEFLYVILMHVIENIAAPKTGEHFKVHLNYLGVEVSI